MRRRTGWLVLLGGFAVTSCGSDDDNDRGPPPTLPSAPDTRIVGPAPRVTRDVASFDFASDVSVVRYECALDGDAFFAPCTNPLLVEGLTEGDHALAVRAVNADGYADPTPAEHTWVVDLRAPETTIVVAPAAVSVPSASFEFESDEADVTYECSLDGAVFAACTASTPYAGLGDGPHNLRVRAIDAAGNVDLTPAQHVWEADGQAPDTFVASGPIGEVEARVASFDLSSSEANVHFECSLDEAPWAPCDERLELTGLRGGEHVLSVRTIDVAGNVDQLPARWAWSIKRAWLPLGGGQLPQPNYGHQMVYDAGRQRVVLFGTGGGFGEDDYTPLTWEWTGSEWLERSPPVSPPGRNFHGLAYDAGRQRVVLFGGRGSQGAYLTDTWEWDGETWSERQHDGGVAMERSHHGMAYDATRGLVLLFGGARLDVRLSDTWSWDGNSWTLQSPFDSPGGRVGHAMDYDPVRQQIMLWGGSGSTDFPEPVWRWDGLWQTTANPSSPRDCGGAGHAYDARRARWVVRCPFVEDENGEYISVTREWDGTSWSPFEVRGHEPDDYVAMAYDGVRGAPVALVRYFSGFSYGFVEYDLARSAAARRSRRVRATRHGPAPRRRQRASRLRSASPRAGAGVRDSGHAAPQPG